MESKPTISVWYDAGPSGRQLTSIAAAVWLAPAGPALADEAATDAAGALLQPVRPVGGVIGVLMVTDGDSPRVLHNGLAVFPGAHVVRHGDRVDVDRHTFWVSADFHVEPIAYDPAEHGTDVFCFLTKARLVPGQRIKRCPGTPGTSCGVFYKAEAWDMAFQPNTSMKCPNCGCRPCQGRWHPPEPKRKRSLDGILHLIRARS